MVSDKECSAINFERLKKALIYTKTNIIESDDNMSLAVNSLIDINNIITGLNNITLRKVNVEPNWYDKMCMDKDLIGNRLYQSIDQFNERKINHINFYFLSLDSIHPFYDGNGKACNILFVSNFNYGFSIVNKDIYVHFHQFYTLKVEFT